MSWFSEWWYGPDGESKPEQQKPVKRDPIVRVCMETGTVDGPPSMSAELRRKIGLRRVRIEGRQGTLLDRVIFRNYWRDACVREVDLIRDFTKRENMHRELLKAD